MTMGDRQWRDSLDRWLTTPPEEHQGWPDVPVCVECDAQLPATPDREVPGEIREHCSGVKSEWGTDCGKASAHAEHEAVMSAWTEEHRTCRTCGTDNLEIVT
jgi:ribosomal protein L40E